MRHSGRFSIFALAMSITLGIGLPKLMAQDCKCSPLYCKGDPKFPSALQSKKHQLAAAGFPARFVALLDKGGKCLVCLDNSPDIFTILVVQPNGDSRTVPWDQDNERIANDQIRSGQISSYYAFNARKACTCCGEPRAEDRSDYDPKLELNHGTSIKCVKGPSGGPTCN